MSQAVSKYFQGAADDFDAIYGGKGRLGKWVDRKWRSDMYERFRLSFEACSDLSGKKVLDIGCGGGRYSTEFAARGAAKVVGLDFAPRMVALSQEHASSSGVAGQCSFIVGDFMQTEFAERFDVCAAIGVFDYIASPQVFLDKMKDLATQTLILSFPSKSPIRTPIRKVRYWIKRCPLYLYDRDQITDLVGGLGKASIIKIPGQGMDYFVSVDVS